MANFPTIGIAGIKGGIGLGFQRLPERRNDPGRQLFEPGAGGGFAGFQQAFHGALGF